MRQTYLAAQRAPTAPGAKVRVGLAPSRGAHMQWGLCALPAALQSCLKYCGCNGSIIQSLYGHCGCSVRRGPVVGFPPRQTERLAACTRIHSRRNAPPAPCPLANPHRRLGTGEAASCTRFRGADAEQPAQTHKLVPHQGGGALAVAVGSWSALLVAMCVCRLLSTWHHHHHHHQQQQQHPTGTATPNRSPPQPPTPNNRSSWSLSPPTTCCWTPSTSSPACTGWPR